MEHGAGVHEIESLNSDIIAIEIRSPVEIVLSTSNNEFWTTVDAGKTWRRSDPFAGMPCSLPDVGVPLRGRTSEFPQGQSTG